MTSFSALLKTEWLLFKRNLSLFIMGIGLPVMIFLLMSSILTKSYPAEIIPNVIKYIMIAMCIYSSISFSIISFPMMVVEDRNTKWFDFLSMKPIKIWQYYLVKILRIVANFVIAIIFVFSIGYLVKGVKLSASEWLISFLIILFGSICMMGIGFLLTLVRTSEQVAAFSNIILIFLSMISGLWWPIDTFPEFLQKIAKLTPTYHINNMANEFLNKKAFASNSFFVLIAYFFVLVFITLLLRKRYRA
ncbi:ABC transporter permease [Gemella sp. zg-570]|uniref:ABC transporter permease n=1 Tax=Gemella sp. zg-570 TaxID=2840371 RepID=UPI001C0B1446|nr:ABC transporter permease [Gemella sp. zg-570]QWQ38876.1 ABC transporter permease [Gemella sp. zg-570]